MNDFAPSSNCCGDVARSIRSCVSQGMPSRWPEARRVCIVLAASTRGEASAIRTTSNPCLWAISRRGLVRNACVALGNLRDEASVGPLLSVVHDPSSDAIVRGHAAWALGRIGGLRARSGLEKASKAVAAGSALDPAELEYATELNAALSLATTH
ncbi:MAG: hypothetical protein EB039_06490 [Proteobacteria bacterium]|nr:hypothetical protein [Pseudomonadota bacterium]